jgi:phosphoethanolamine N-methyltransferase
MTDNAPLQYREATIAKLELLWGEGFMSVGGPAEVSAICHGVDLTGLDILDIGCGIGGVDFLLVKEHGAASVLGLDVSQHLLDLGRLRAERAGLSDKVSFRLCASPPYPVPDQHFDVVFSKGSILHIPDKFGLFRDLARCLKPGGMFIASDWLKGDGAEVAGAMTHFGAADITLESAPASEMEAAMREAAFTCVEMSDQTEQYLKIARQDLSRMKGRLRTKAIELLGDEGFESWISAQAGTVARLAERQVQPTHIRAVLR